MSSSRIYKGNIQRNVQTYKNSILQDLPIETTKHYITIYLEHKFRQIRADYHSDLPLNWLGHSKIESGDKYR